MFQRAAVVIAFILCLCGLAGAQVAPPTGTVSVRIVRAVDSSAMRVGQGIPGAVVSSSNGSVPVGSGAALQLVANPGGGFSLQLARLGVNGQMFGTTSSSATLPNGSPASGPSLSIPANTVITFVLGEASARGPARVPPAQNARSAAPRHPDKSVVDLPPAADGYPPIHASAPVAQDDCWWAPFVSKKFGLEAAVQTCASKSATETVSDTDTGLQWQTNPTDGQAQKGQFVTVLTKPADQPIEAAIKEQFIAKLKVPAARTSCKALPGLHETPTENTLVSKNNPAIQFYVVRATGPYSKLKKFNSDESSEEACPGLETNDAISVFFQYNPSESKTKFLLFQEDDNGSVLNSDSIHLLKEQ